MPAQTGGARSGAFCRLDPPGRRGSRATSPGGARPSFPPHRVTGLRVVRELAWFRVRGYGLWVKWGSGRDLHTTRKTAHYLGPLRWKILSPQGTG